MNKAKILVLGGLREDALTDLKEVCQVDIGPVGHRPEDDREWVLDHIAEYDGVIVAKMVFDQEMIDAAKNLKIISTYGVGFDHVDIEYAKEKSIVVSNCPKSVLRPTAELAWTLIMASARRLHYYDHALREGVYLNADEYDNQGYSIEGKTLGILGLGRIGQQVARFARAFGMKVIYHNRHQADEKVVAELGAKYVDLDTLAKESDFVSLHTPATDETYHIIDADFLKKMKDTAFLVNVARGSLVDGDALIAALKNGSIAGAALDVFENEPYPKPELVGMDNVIMTPHVGSATHVARFNLSQEAANNVLSFFKDNKAINQIN
ncbi:NAD(P)-dependent oxidoreductase [uncultured Lactobacillus sp.]|uniref:NAD(P)-dependent oxidoreductase n=1 Tax=uncultured Lactobacillus sp. TaxID=153152 RepID=UPI00260666A3|nr:NAD(P)-dependent oxidoreductase [uncultured Lactobacillus sp.]